ncbi:hypothetical protein PR202_ga30319 [Eleusine coracana subsp. coracana]|uniref:Uncharacterized protein n=1 Tax=Eleusine coracana subsp. coracana TaxID=191504 RepID=A0AAV5DLZ4_ELECO|nr:hypothetical protein PR202_ga30319 [Eleusine coracana subsp. coracana]
MRQRRNSNTMFPRFSVAIPQSHLQLLISMPCFVCRTPTEAREEEGGRQKRMKRRIRGPEGIALGGNELNHLRSNSGCSRFMIPL